MARAAKDLTSLSIVSEYQNLRVGDIIPDGESETAYFTVAAVQKNRHIVYQDDVGSHVSGITFTSAFGLRPLDDGTTRIQVRWRNGPVSSFLIRIVVRLLVAPADFVMMNQVLGDIKRRAERAERQHEDIHGQSTLVKKEPGAWTARLKV